MAEKSRAAVGKARSRATSPHRHNPKTPRRITETSPSSAGRPARNTSTSSSRLKIQIDLPGGARLGPGKIELLEQIESEGSLSRAAEKMGISYRRAWLFMSQINKAFDEVAVATPEGGHGGGPARLTPFGRELIENYRAIEAEAALANERIIKWLDRHRRPMEP